MGANIGYGLDHLLGGALRGYQVYDQVHSAHQAHKDQQAHLAAQQAYQQQELAFKQQQLEQQAADEKLKTDTANRSAYRDALLSPGSTLDEAQRRLAAQIVSGGMPQPPQPPGTSLPGGSLLPGITGGPASGPTFGFGRMHDALQGAMSGNLAADGSVQGAYPQAQPHPSLAGQMTGPDPSFVSIFGAVPRAQGIATDTASAKLDDTRAGTAKTQQETKNLGQQFGQNEQLFPGQLQQQGAGIAKTQAETAGMQQQQAQNGDLFPLQRSDLAATSALHHLQVDAYPAQQQADLLGKQAHADSERATADYLRGSGPARIEGIKADTAVKKAEAAAIPARLANDRDKVEVSRRFAAVSEGRLRLDSAVQSGNTPKAQLELKKIGLEVDKFQADHLIPPEMKANIDSLNKQLQARLGAGVGGIAQPGPDAGELSKQLQDSLRDAAFVAQSQREGLTARRAQVALQTFSQGGDLAAEQARYDRALQSHQISPQEHAKAVQSLRRTWAYWQQLNKQGAGGATPAPAGTAGKGATTPSPNLLNP